jgi:hypothetical protein
MIPKLSGPCYTIRSMVHTSNINTLKSIYYEYFHSAIKYGIIFFFNFSISWKLFMLQKIIIRVMAGAQPRTLCRSLFKQLKILSIPCQYILSLMSFNISNQEILQTNSFIHNITTRNKHHHRRPNANLYCFKKSTFYAGIKIFNGLPPSVTVLKNDKAKFKAALRKCLHTQLSYYVDEFFMCKGDLQFCFWKMFVAFYILNVYICVFMTCSTS